MDSPMYLRKMMSREQVLFLFGILMVTLGEVNAQQLPELSPSKPDTYIVVEHMPEFPGGQDSLFHYVSSHMNISENAEETGVSGKIFISYIVDKSGKVRDVTVKRGLTAELDAEAVRVIKSMPNWKPGTQGDIPVNVQMNLPISIIIKK
ncbi:hypothetical protein BH11BAC2_BH11BAC2_22410 [soil metagenome]